MPFAEVNGQNIHYQDTGGDGPAIILSHGFGMGHEMWVHQIAPLVGAGWRVVTYAERSWGQPQGGFLSMRAALATPERVRALVLVDTEAEVYSDEDRAQFQALFDAAIAMGLTGEVGDVLAMTLFGPGFADVRYWRGKWTAKPIAAWLGAKECLFERDDILDRLGEITCPSIVFHGDADVAIPVERGQRVSDSMSGPSTFVVVPGAGHASNLEAPDLVNPAMLEFLAGLD